jgi:DNA-binding transcriptional MerR regulator
MTTEEQQTKALQDIHVILEDIKALKSQVNNLSQAASPTWEIISQLLQHRSLELQIELSKQKQGEQQSEFLNSAVKLVEELMPDLMKFIRGRDLR